MVKITFCLIKNYIFKSQIEACRANSKLIAFIGIGCKFIEELGTYLPRKKTDNFSLDLERAKYWLSKGAQPSETVASFIKKAAKAAAAAA